MIADVAAIGRHELGEQPLAGGDHGVATLGDLERVLDRAFEVPVVLDHRLGRLDIKLVAVEAQPVRRIDLLAGLHAEHHVVRVVVVGGQVVTIVSGDHRQVIAAGDADQLVVDLLLLGEAVVHDLDEEVIAAEDLQEVIELLLSLACAPFEQHLADGPLQAGGRCDQALGISLDQVHIDARLVVKALEVACRNEAREVGIALGRLAKHQKVIARAGMLAGAVGVGRRGEVGLAAENRLDAPLLAGFLERERAKEVAVIGQRDGTHAQLAATRDEPIDAASAIQRAE